MASLETEYSIKKFAIFFVMEYSKVNSTTREFVCCFNEFMNDDISKEILNCINLLLKHYKDIVEKINIQEFEDKLFVRSKRDYMRELVKRCLKLSEGDATFFEFLLVCVYIFKFSECIYATYKCCEILKVTAQCLKNVYRFKYWGYFAENNGFRGFANFCRSLSNCEPSIKYVNGGCITLFPEVVDLEKYKKVKELARLNVINDADSTSEVEIKRSDDEAYLNPCLRETDFLDKGDFLVGLVFRSDEDVEKEGWVNVAEKTYKTGICCEHCWTKCYQFFKNIVDFTK